MHRLYQDIIFCLAIILFVFSACCTTHKIDGWYRIAANADNSIIGKPYLTLNDFESIELKDQLHVIEGDTIHQYLIQGRVKDGKVDDWADITETLIGNKVGFIFNDSVITSVRINARIENGSFQIVSPDTNLLIQIYNSISQIINQNE